jgi:hypothetical protein
MRPWGRLYSGTRHHRKIKRLRSICPRTWWIFYELLEMAFETDDQGKIYFAPGVPYKCEEYARELHVDCRSIARVMQALCACDLIQMVENIPQFVGWDDRQFRTDISSAERSRISRGKNATSLQRPCNNPDTDTDTDTDTEKRIKPFCASGEAPPENGVPFYLTRKKRKLTGKRLESFEQFWKAFAYPKGKAGAADAWMDIPQLTNAILTQILAKAKLEAAERAAVIADNRTPIFAQGWITGRRWEDETAEIKSLSWSERRELERSTA